MRKAIVRAKAVTNKLHSCDIDVAGDYEVSLNEEVVDEQIADVALDVFHDSVPIKVLDDFEFTVLFNGEVKEPAPEHESYSYKHLGCM